MSSRTPHRGVGGSPVRPKDTKKVSDIMEVGGASEGEDDIEAEEVESGQRFTKKLGDPRMPCEAEVKEHEFTHLPFRSWCRHCVRGRGKEMPHVRSREQPEGPEVHMDFCFMGEEGGGPKLTTLVAKERNTKMMMASVVPYKSTGTFIAKRIVAFMREVGCEQGDVTIKTDQEPAMKAIVTEVGRVRAAAGGGRMVVESSPVKQSASNGVVERAIGSEEAQVRVSKSALEARWKMSIESGHPILPWMVEYVAVLMNRFEVGRDGMTSFERCKAKKAKMMGVEFEEETRGRGTRKIDVLVGRWHLHRGEGDDRRDDHRHGEGDLEDEDVAKEAN
jgi:hypothetical protein